MKYRTISRSAAMSWERSDERVADVAVSYDMRARRAELASEVRDMHIDHRVHASKTPAAKRLDQFVFRDGSSACGK